MNPTQLTHFETLLLAERTRIRVVLTRIAAAGQALRDAGGLPPGDEGEAGVVGVGPYDDDALVARETAALVEVEDALKVLRGTPDRYGSCVRCERRIPEPRLELVPATRYCEKHAA